MLDPNGPVSFGTPLTPTGTFGAISISRKHHDPATAVFRVEVASTLGELAKGCDPSQTNTRFVIAGDTQPAGLPLGSPGSENWLASGVTTTLFSQLGVALLDPSNTVLMIPGITGVISQQCAPFPPFVSQPFRKFGFLDPGGHDRLLGVARHPDTEVEQGALITMMAPP